MNVASNTGLTVCRTDIHTQFSLLRVNIQQVLHIQWCGHGCKVSLASKMSSLKNECIQSIILLKCVHVLTCITSSLKNECIQSIILLKCVHVLTSITSSLKNECIQSIILLKCVHVLTSITFSLKNECIQSIILLECVRVLTCITSFEIAYIGEFHQPKLGSFCTIVKPLHPMKLLCSDAVSMATDYIPANHTCSAMCPATLNYVCRVLRCANLSALCGFCTNCYVYIQYHSVYVYVCTVYLMLYLTCTYVCMYVSKV